MLDLTQYGTSRPFAWTHDHLVRILSTGRDPILSDPLVINAFRTIDRADFTPSEHLDKAYMDKAIDIGFDEQMSSPTTVAKLVQTVRPALGGNYLHLGSGTGYLASILGFIAGKAGRVHSLERILWIWEKAKKHRSLYPELTNTFVLLRDGQFGLEEKGPYDGIIVSYSLPHIPVKLQQQLKVGSRLIVPFPDHSIHILERTGEDTYVEEVEYGYVFTPGKVGLA
ncbi:MAG: hypothetical protein JNK26_02620 [Candidatus Doudnabacteria bacterium]|nr:hypothetical protein [Candidatus Doudnabacteria bacterium]